MVRKRKRKGILWDYPERVKFEDPVKNEILNTGLDIVITIGGPLLVLFIMINTLLMFVKGCY